MKIIIEDEDLNRANANESLKLEETLRSKFLINKIRFFIRQK